MNQSCQAIITTIAAMLAAMECTNPHGNGKVTNGGAGIRDWLLFSLDGFAKF